MNLEECYKVIDGDLDDLKTRLSKHASIVKYLRRFLDDGEFARMLEAYEAKDYATVFEASHNLKGMANNLSITGFGRSISEVCEAVRDGNIKDNLPELIAAAKVDYDKIITAIMELED